MATRNFILLLGLLAFGAGLMAQRNTPGDGDWSARAMVKKNTPEADIMLRVGDIDNLGFGFDEEFDPFSGRTYNSHEYPWDIDPNEVPGLDAIILPASYGKKESPCGNEGYSNTERGPLNPLKAFPITIPLDAVKGAALRSAAMQLFVDDFQSPTLCTQFRAWLNNTRFSELEAVLNALDQTGPVGKLIQVSFPERMLPLLQQDKLVLMINDSLTSAGDGYAIDFVKLLINPKPYRKGTLQVYVKDINTYEPIRNASLSAGGLTVTTNAEGYAEIPGMVPGLVKTDASANGYIPVTKMLDVTTEPYVENELFLSPIGSRSIRISDRDLNLGESLVLNNIQFAVNSAALNAAARAELDNIAGIMLHNPSLRIELSGHTSSEGDPKANRELSLKRVQACRQYLISTGIFDARIEAVGMGPDRPVAPNSSEEGRKLNRRVEAKVIGL